MTQKKTHLRLLLFAPNCHFSLILKD